MASDTDPPADVDCARRRFLAPEVIQTSAMDCGPAALRCLLEGFGVSVNYRRLREACQTSVDGTSVDALEAVARMLGLDAEQLMVPAEHVLAPAAGLLPAIAMVRADSGQRHFVVLWRQVGPYLQVMDPARGRRWVRSSTFLRDLHRHTQTVQGVALQRFLADGGFTAPLEWRLRALVGRRRAHAWSARVAAAQTEAGGEGPGPANEQGGRRWRRLALLDGAARAVTRLVDERAVQRGAEADAILGALLDEGAGEKSLLNAHCCVSSDASDGDGAAQVRFTGAVLVRARLPVGLRMPRGPRLAHGRRTWAGHWRERPIGVRWSHD